MQIDNTSETGCFEAPSPEELTAWEKYKAENQITSIDIPYVIPFAAVNVAGVFYLKDSVENSYTEGVVVGAVLGNYRLDQNRTKATFKDPTGQFVRLDMVIDFKKEVLKARLCNRKLDGRWNCGDWKNVRW